MLRVGQRRGEARSLPGGDFGSEPLNYPPSPQGVLEAVSGLLCSSMMQEAVDHG